MLRYLKMIIAGIAMVVIIVFAVGNRELVEISFFPLPLDSVNLPLSLIFLFGILVGAILGGIALWLSSSSMRADYNKLRRRDRALRHQQKTKERQEEIQAAKASIKKAEPLTALPSLPR